MGLRLSCPANYHAAFHQLKQDHQKVQTRTQKQLDFRFCTRNRKSTAIQCTIRSDRCMCCANEVYSLSESLSIFFMVLPLLSSAPAWWRKQSSDNSGGIFWRRCTALSNFALSAVAFRFSSVFCAVAARFVRPAQTCARAASPAATLRSCWRCNKSSLRPHENHAAQRLQIPPSSIE